MPGGEKEKEKLPRCPKGEVRDKKTKKCVKKEKKPSPKKNTTQKATPLKRASSKSVSSRSSSSRKSIDIPTISKIKSSISSYNLDYLKEFIIRLLKENDSFRYRGSNESFLYYMFDDVISFLEKEINTIKKYGKAGGFYFPEESSKKIIPILNKYDKYFKDVAGEDELMVKQIDIEKLYK